MKDLITVVVTACGRPDLLEQTLESFLKYTAFEGRILVIEDSGIPNVNQKLQDKYKQVEWLQNETNLGQIASIDKAYSLVTTQYIFHLEEDWLMYDSGVLEESLDMLESEPTMSAVMCRAEGEGSYHFLKDKQSGLPTKFLRCQDPWGHYSFNPGLRRLSDYKNLFGTFSEFTQLKGLQAEIAINNRFKNAGFRMGLTSKGYVKHIGDFRHVKDQRIILTMIVKNEAHVIRETLDNVAPFVDAQAITDTGSTDNTIDLIQDFFRDHPKKIPGKIFRNAFVDFGTTRTQAFRNAETLANHGDYLLVIDADDLINKTPASQTDLRDILKKGPNQVMVTFKSGTTYERAQIFKAHDGYVQKGVLHEQPTNLKDNNLVLRWPITWQSRRLGARNQDPQKYLKDALTLAKAHLQEPDNERYVFYLAQSYKDAGLNDLAAKYYELRYSMKRWNQEVFYSAYQLTKIQNSKEWAWKAHEACTERAESLHAQMSWCRANNMWSQELQAMALYASSIQKPKNALFLEEDIYDWRILDELAIIAQWTGHKDTSKTACEKLLAERKFPPDRLERIQKNLQFALN